MIMGYSDIRNSLNTNNIAEAGGMKMNSFLQPIPKLESGEGWLRWKNEMQDYLTMIDLWHYIKDPDFRIEPAEKDNASTFKRNYAKAITAMRNQIA